MRWWHAQSFAWRWLLYALPSTQYQSSIVSKPSTRRSVPKPFQSLIDRGFEVMYVSHAAAILAHDFPDASAEIEQVLNEMDLPITEIIGSGGGETKFTQRLRKGLAALD